MSGEGYEESLLRGHEETAVAIGHALRQAAGLSKEDDPFVIINPDYKNLPKLRLVASEIIVASHGKAPIAMTPKSIAKNLGDIRRKSRYLSAQIAAIDSSTRSTINRAGSAEHAALKDLPKDAREDEITSAVRSVGTVPHEQWTVPAVLTAMKRLEDALVPVIERAFQNSQSDLIPATGRPPDMAKLGVALTIGKFLKEATGEVPKLWPDDAPAEPWKRGESSEPFAVALREIFEILGFRPGIQAAGEYATSEL